MKTFLTCLIAAFLPLVGLAQAPILRNAVTTNQFMNLPADLMIPFWNAAAGKWSNAVNNAATATNAQPPSTILTNLATYGVNYALSNIIVVQATPNVLTNGILLTNAVKQAGTLASATRHILVKMTPGKYITPVNTAPSVMTAVDNVSTYWEEGAEWGSGTAGGDSAFMWDFTAGNRTNCNILGFGRFWLTNDGASIVFVENSSRVFVQGLSFYATDGGSTAGPFTWDGTAIELTLDVRDYAESAVYDTMYGDVTGGQKVRGRIQEARAFGDVFEFNGDSPQWGLIDLEIPIARQTHASGQSTFMAIGGRCKVKGSQAFVTSTTQSRISDGGSTTNGIIEGYTIQYPANSTASPISFISPATTASGFTLRNVTIYGPTNVDIGNITNTVSNPLTLDNCTFYTGWASTNWIRGSTPSFVRILGGLALHPFKPLGSQVTVLGTNYHAGIHNAGSITNQGAGHFTGAGRFYGSLTVDGSTVMADLTASQPITANGGITGSDAAFNNVNVLNVTVPAIAAIEANNTITNVTLAGGLVLHTPSMVLSNSATGGSSDAIANLNGRGTNTTFLNITNLGNFTNAGNVLVQGSLSADGGLFANNPSVVSALTVQGIFQAEAGLNTFSQDLTVGGQLQATTVLKVGDLGYEFYTNATATSLSSVLSLRQQGGNSILDVINGDFHWYTESFWYLPQWNLDATWVNLKLGANQSHTTNLLEFLNESPSENAGAVAAFNAAAALVVGSLVDADAGAGDISITNNFYLGGRIIADKWASIIWGSGSPEGSITANVGSVFYCTNGCTSSGAYVKTNGTGNTGWWLIQGGGGGGTSPGGSSGAVQFNQGGAFAGTNEFTFDRAEARTIVRHNVSGSSLSTGFLPSTDWGLNVSNTAMVFALDGTIRWVINSGASIGSITPFSANTYDIGALAATVRTNYANDFYAVENVTVGGNIAYGETVVTGVGGANTNFTLLSGYGKSIINGFTNVSIRAIMGGTAGLTYTFSITITNGSGSNRTLEFSAVTNNWRWSYAQGGTAPTTLTNSEEIVITGELRNTNITAAYAYYPWP